MRTFLVGVTQPDKQGIKDYLQFTGQLDFLQSWDAATCGDQLCLVSMFAKLCYRSLVLGKNANVTRLRDIPDNIKSVIASGHGSVFEHVWLNFISTGVSRVFTHELVRHRVGTAFSQTSGRYVSIDKIDIVLPPELTDASVLLRCPNPFCAGGKLLHDEDSTACPVCNGKGQVPLPEFIQYEINEQGQMLKELRDRLISENMPFETKKKITSAIRRLAPNGQDNEIGWSCNIRALRHMIIMRTSRHAEWEIRQVFNEVADIVLQRWPLMLHGLEKNEAGEWVGDSL